jgi:hypothetical protein
VSLGYTVERKGGKSRLVAQWVPQGTPKKKVKSVKDKKKKKAQDPEKLARDVLAFHDGLIDGGMTDALEVDYLVRIYLEGRAGK